MNARLLVTYGNKQGIMYVLGPTTVIGRASSSQVQLVDAQVSRQHCRITINDGVATIADLGSANGTLVNEQPVAGEHPLTADDQIQVGHATLVFEPSFDIWRDDHGDHTVVFVDANKPLINRAVNRPGLFQLDAEQSGLLRSVSDLIAQAPDLNSLANGFLDAVFAALQPDSLYLIARQQDGRLLPLAGRARDATVSLSRGIVERVWRSGEPFETSDALLDIDFQQRLSVARHQLRTVLCLPLRHLGVVTAVCYLATREADSVTEASKDALYLATLFVQPVLSLLLNREQHKAARDDLEQSLVAESTPMKAVLDLVSKVAASDSSVLITGESGTGKECVASLIHTRSGRRRGPFVAVNCAAIPLSLIEGSWFGHERGAFSGADERKIGLIEAANGGTLFLDEIAEIPPHVQAKLLRVLQERVLFRVGGTRPIRLDIRVLAATNRKLDHEIAQGRFREDLYFRLNVIEIALPPLRGRAGDLALMLERFLVESRQRLGRATPREYSKRAYKQLLAYAWPGNVRELQNAIERLTLLTDGPVIALGDLPLEIRQPQLSDSLHERIRELERDHIYAVYRRCEGNKSETARRLQISRPTLDKRLHELDIEPGFES